MKRIIKNKAYNTDTATQLSKVEDAEAWDLGGVSRGEALYQNRFGAFFLHQWSQNGPDGEDFERIAPLTAHKAKEWLLRNDAGQVDLIESLFGAVPEAGSKEAKYTLRLPISLQKRLAALAQEEDVSLNAWMVRALERAASRPNNAGKVQAFVRGIRLGQIVEVGKPKIAPLRINKKPVRPT